MTMLDLFDNDDDLNFDEDVDSLADEGEYYFICPYCWQEISMLIDPYVPEQEYIEDCEICCNPIQIHYQIEGGYVSHFSAGQAE